MLGAPDQVLEKLEVVKEGGGGGEAGRPMLDDPWFVLSKATILARTLHTLARESKED